MIDYGIIYRQAYAILRAHKFLWAIGLFLSTCSIIYRIYWNPKFEDVQTVVVYALVFLVFMVLYYWAKTALIIGIKAVVDKQPTSFAKSWVASKLFFSRVLTVSLIVDGTLLIVFAVLGSPIIYLFDQEMTLRGSILLFFGIIILLPIVAAAVLIGELAPLFVVVYDQTIFEALRKSYELVQKFWYQLVVVVVFLFGLDLPALFLGAFMVESGRGLAVSISAVVLFLFIQSLFFVYQQAVWFLVFNQIIKPQKLEEEAILPAPEIV